MFSHNGNVLKLVEIENQGGYEGEWFCYYEYKEECEPEANKIRWTNPKDRWYEGYMTQKQIQQAIDSGARFVDKDNIFKIYNCEHEWMDFDINNIVCGICGINKNNV